MPEFLTSPFSNGPVVAPKDVAIRLTLALLLGWLVAVIYSKTRKASEVTPSFFSTLILLSVLIAMVTQVIGDNVARAFSLVGALSIVRFRTVVRDTQDTAYVIFAVIVGMAVGARNLWVAVIGMVIIAFAAVALKILGARIDPPEFLLNLRFAIGLDYEKFLKDALAKYFSETELLSLATAKQGTSLEISYKARLRALTSADELVRTLNRIEGVQSVQLQRLGFEDV